MGKHKKQKEGKLLRCSFCGSKQDDVEKLIAGPGVYICDECVDICNDIVEDDEKDELETIVEDTLRRIEEASEEVNEIFSDSVRDHFLYQDDTSPDYSGRPAIPLDFDGQLVVRINQDDRDAIEEITFTQTKSVTFKLRK